MPRTSTVRRYRIAIADRQSALKVDRRRLRAMAVGTLAAEQVAAAEISLALVGDAEIHDINREYLSHDCPTDVISFLLESDPEPRVTVPRGRGRKIAGEIVLSTETAIAEAGRYGWSPQDECGLYLVHGLLHLCGYDDLTKAEQTVMRRRETEILARWKLVPRYAMKPVASRLKFAPR